MNAPTPKELMRQVVEGAVPTTFPEEGMDDPYQPGNTGESPGRRVLLTCGSDMNPQPVRWLWKHWLAVGKLAILAGQPGQGKTTLAISLASIVTSGGLWPDGSESRRGNVLIWSGEDDPSDTLLPRLLASGGDRSRCYFIKGTHDSGGLDTFDPARDIAALESVISEIGGVSLLIIDPVVSAVAGDDHKNSAVRRALQPVVDLAAKLDMAVLGISHFSKGGAGSDPASRVVGSVAFTAMARIVIVAAKSNKSGDEGNRIFARAKSNIGPDDGGFEYRIEQKETINGIHASNIQWGESVAGNARDLLAEAEVTGAEASGAEDLKEMLRQELTSETWTPANTVTENLKAAGFTSKQIWASSNKLSIIRKKGGMDGGWYWRLPPGSDARPSSTPEPDAPGFRDDMAALAGTVQPAVSDSKHHKQAAASCQPEDSAAHEVG